MLTITGELRKIIDDQYTDKNKRTIQQAILILEPERGRQNYEVFLSPKQVQAGAKDTWLKLQGKTASVEVSLFVNHDYKFHKFNATGSGQPLTVAAKSR